MSEMSDQQTFKSLSQAIGAMVGGAVVLVVIANVISQFVVGA